MKLKVKKPISKWNKLLKFNFSDFFKSITKSVVSFWGLTPYHGVKDLIDSLKSISFENDISGNAYKLILISIINSVYEILEQNKDKLSSKYQTLDKIYDSQEFIDLLDRLDTILGNTETTITNSWFKTPTKIDVYKKFKLEYKNWLILFGLTEPQTNLILESLDTYFIWNLNNEWRANFEEYNPIFQHLNTPFTDASKKEVEWMTYESFLSKQLEESVFEEMFSIRQVYIPLRGYLTNENKERIQKIGEHEFYKTEHIVCDVSTFLSNWIKSPDSHFKIISGGPGSGKSTLTKVLCSKIAKSKTAKVLYIPLQHYNINKGLPEALSELIHFEGILSFNPLEEIHNLKKPLLLVFDGLDELSKQGSFAVEVAKEFINEIKRTLSITNSNTTKLLCILTGRILSVQGQFHSNYSAKNIINLLPYYIPKENRLDYIDSSDLLRVDQRKVWWRKYLKAKHNKTGQYPKSLQKAALVEITSQPLLNYLVALSYQRKKVDFSKKTNLNLIYEDLISSVYNRNYEKKQHSALTELSFSESNFIRILEEIAFSAWQNGEVRTTTVKNINKHIKANKLSSLFNEFQKGAEAGIIRLLTAFYFRQKGIDQSQNKTFEFTHKTFGEYLVARRLVNLIGLMYKRINENKHDPDNGWDIEEGIKRFVELTGYNTIDNYILKFLRNEFRLLGKETNLNYQNILIEVIQYIDKNSVPVELINPRPDSFKISLDIANNSEENLFCLLSICGENSNELININWSKETSLGDMIRRLSNQKMSHKNRTSNQSGRNRICAYLSNMIIENQVITSRDLSRAIIRNSKLHKVVFAGSDLWGADFTNSLIEDCNFYRSSIYNANFRSCELKYSKDYPLPSVTLRQLYSCNSLRGLKGLPIKIRNKMKEKYEDIFKADYLPRHETLFHDEYITRYKGF